MILSICDLIILDSILLLIILFFMFKWFFGQIRQICKEPEGIIKFGQLAFIILSWGCFVTILIYFTIRPDVNVNMLNVFLTIIVGFLGTIIGLFFSKETITSLNERLELRGNRLLNDTEFLEDVEKLVIENEQLREKLEKLKSRRT